MTIRNIIPIIALVWAVGISIASLVMPPPGEIDNSVLILIAQIIIFIATFLGLNLPEYFNRLKK